MNEAIRELRCAMNLADGVGDKMDDLYMYGVAAGIRFALEHLDEGSTERPQSHAINFTDTASGINAFLAHGY